MNNAKTANSITTKYSRHYVAIILVFLCLIVSWYNYKHYTDFKRHQSDLMMQSVHGASSEITAIIIERQRSVKVFADHHKELLYYLAKHPEDETKYHELHEIIKNRFPNSFAFTIADENGEPILGNYDLLVNELCQSNIKEFVANNYNYDVFIHPHPTAYHFDIMTAWGIKQSSSNEISNGVFFISFKPKIITRILKNAEIHHHKLFLLKQDIPNLIEISSQGTRIDIPELKGDFFLNIKQINRIGYSKAVSKTRWNLVDIPYDNLFVEYRNEIIVQTLFILISFILISFIFLGLARRQEKIRLKSENALEHIKDQLEQALSFSKTSMWEYDIVSKTFAWSERANAIFHQMVPKVFDDYISLVPKEEQQSVQESFENCIKTGYSHRIEHRIETDGQNENWIEITGNIEHDNNKCSIKMIGLVRDITIRKLAEENRISFEIQQKNTLVREVHHRIKNNLQGVVGLLRQHGKYSTIENIMLDHAVSQLNSVSLVHGIQSDDAEQHISVTQLVEMICKATLEIMGVHVKPNIITTPNAFLYIDEKNAVPVALIVNELIFNAAKHTQNLNNDNIHIEISLANEKIIITIQNDGAILPENFNFEKRQGLGTGLSLIKSLLPREGAMLSIEQINVGVFSTLTLTKPVLHDKKENSNGNSNNRKSA